MNLVEIEKEIKLLENQKEYEKIDSYLKGILIQKIKSFQAHMLYALKNKYSKSECKKIIDDGNKEIEDINNLCFSLFKFTPYKKDILNILIKNAFPSLLEYLS